MVQPRINLVNIFIFLAVPKDDMKYLEASSKLLEKSLEIEYPSKVLGEVDTWRNWEVIWNCVVVEALFVIVLLLHFSSNCSIICFV